MKKMKIVSKKHLYVVLGVIFGLILSVSLVFIGSTSKAQPVEKYKWVPKSGKYYESVQSVKLSSKKASFTDLARNSAWNEIRQLYSLGITSGVTKTVYNPAGSVTRLQMALFLYRLVGEPDFTPEDTHTFKDVSKLSKSDLQAVNWLYSSGISTGTDKKSQYFSPKETVTRLQMALFLYRLFSPSDYKIVKANTKVAWKDLKKSSQDKTAVSFLADLGVTTGTTSKTFSPYQLVTRAQMALFLTRSYSKLSGNKLPSAKDTATGSIAKATKVANPNVKMFKNGWNGDGFYYDYTASGESKRAVFEGGRSLSVISVNGTWKSKWIEHGGAKGAMGLPVTKAKCDSPKRNGKSGCHQDFENGEIFWASGVGKHAVIGDLLKKYAAQGYERGKYGYPKIDETQMCGGNWYQAFEKGVFSIGGCNPNNVKQPYFVYADGQKIIVANKKNPLPANWAPGENSTAVSQLRKFIAAANRAGIGLQYSWSGYRSYSRQAGLYNSYARRDGKAAADTYSARPGYSEHQTGFAFDLIDRSGNLYRGNDRSYNYNTDWVAQHAANYGFIIRYRAEWESVTGYEAEPWHLRYLGVSLAKKVKKANQPLETYLNFAGGGY
ncbi:MAG: D-alanyl-D-alanine carboxypeptidase family protein [Candidatus Ancillula sp.]|jgi:D-alanyl-D-alanine carboxypeptidase|nr:D-alanyl-D-alanine carboxypeptidase family protein [Candidatus Ancillula sp.]